MLKGYTATATLIFIVLAINACSSSSIPFIPPQIGVADATPTPLSLLNPLSDFPLTPGSYWVYSHTEYWEDQVETGLITVSVFSNQMQGAHFLAQMKVELSFAPQWAPDGLGAGSSDFWYATDQQGRVYSLWDLPEAEDFTDSILAYRFPLESTECWFRSADLWNALGENCTFADGPQVLETPAGVFGDCFSIVTPYLSGGTRDWVCKGVGYAGAKYDHLGSPFGYETTLIEYKIAPP